MSTLKRCSTENLTVAPFLARGVNEVQDEFEFTQRAFAAGVGSLSPQTNVFATSYRDILHDVLTEEARKQSLLAVGDGQGRPYHLAGTASYLVYVCNYTKSARDAE